MRRRSHLLGSCVGLLLALLLRHLLALLLWNILAVSVGNLGKNKFQEQEETNYNFPT